MRTGQEEMRRSEAARQSQKEGQAGGHRDEQVFMQFTGNACFFCSTATFLLLTGPTLLLLFAMLSTRGFGGSFALAVRGAVGAAG